MNAVAVIGGGPAGLMAAIASAGEGAGTTVFDAAAPGATVLRTGGGRCNLANAVTDPRELAASYPRGEKFLLSVFSRFGSAQTLEWFRSRGLRLVVEDEGRVFPASGKAADVRELLVAEARRLGRRPEGRDSRARPGAGPGRLPRPDSGISRPAGQPEGILIGDYRHRGRLEQPRRLGIRARGLPGPHDHPPRPLPERPGSCRELGAGTRGGEPPPREGAGRARRAPGRGREGRPAFHAQGHFRAACLPPLLALCLPARQPGKPSSRDTRPGPRPRPRAGGGGDRGSHRRPAAAGRALGPRPLGSARGRPRPAGPCRRGPRHALRAARQAEAEDPSRGCSAGCRSR